MYLQLRTLRKTLDCEIYYYQDGRHEIDFALVHLGKIVQLTQVSYSVESAKTRERELSALFDVGRKLKCEDLVLITDHENGEEKRGGADDGEGFDESGGDGRPDHEDGERGI